MAIDVGKKIEEIVEIASEICSQWECDFVESVSSQLEEGRNLSPKQISIIDGIYEKACNSPY